MGILNSILSLIFRKVIKEKIEQTVTQTIEQHLPKAESVKPQDVGSPVFHQQPQSEADRKVLQRMAEVLPQYPVWSVGGYEFELSEFTEDSGDLSYQLTLRGTQQMLNNYKLLLLAQGFRYVDNNSSGDVIKKNIDGKCHCFIFTDAVTDDQVMVGFMINDEYINR